MARKKQNPESARRRVGQLLTAAGWDRIRRRAWLDEHSQLTPQALRRAAEVELGVDWKVWSGLQKKTDLKDAPTAKDEKEGKQ